MITEEIGPSPPTAEPAPKLHAALVKAQAAMSNPKFDCENSHFKSRYASLAAVRDAVLPVLAAHGIAVIQEPFSTERGAGCTTVLLHESGETYRCPALLIPASKQDAHGFGSALTYARRYALQAVAGVVGDADDDANGAVAKAEAPKSKSVARRTKVQSEPAAEPAVDTVALGVTIAGAKSLAELEPLKAQILGLRTTSVADYTRFRDAWKEKQGALAPRGAE